MWGLSLRREGRPPCPPLAARPSPPLHRGETPAAATPTLPTVLHFSSLRGRVTQDPLLQPRRPSVTPRGRLEALRARGTRAQRHCGARCGFVARGTPRADYVREVRVIPTGRAGIPWNQRSSVCVRLLASGGVRAEERGAAELSHRESQVLCLQSHLAPPGPAPRGHLHLHLWCPARPRPDPHLQGCGRCPTATQLSGPLVWRDGAL